MIRRAKLVNISLKTQDYKFIWPRLVLISCWDQGRAKGDAEVIRKLFPNAHVQGKGLLATEGIVTIPWFGEKKVSAITSHTLKFKESGAVLSDGLTLQSLLNVETGVRYEVYLSTGNGSEDYPLGDVVECSGFVGRTPCFDFIARNRVCDLKGEKIHETQCESIIAELEYIDGLFKFAMFMPLENEIGYCFCYEREVPVDDVFLEKLMCQNFYYQEARIKGQLEAVQCLSIKNGMAQFSARSGGTLGGAKNPVLCKQYLKFNA